MKKRGRSGGKKRGKKGCDHGQCDRCDFLQTFVHNFPVLFLIFVSMITTRSIIPILLLVGVVVVVVVVVGVVVVVAVEWVEERGKKGFEEWWAG